jgi:hypothetical protein
LAETFPHRAVIVLVCTEISSWDSLHTIDHPTVQRFYHDHGIDIRGRRVWEVPELDPDHVDVRSRDPLRVSLTHTAAGETPSASATASTTAVLTLRCPSEADDGLVKDGFPLIRWV